MTAGTTPSNSPTTSRLSNIEDTQNVSASVMAASPQSIKSILLADGWHTTQDCQLVQFAIGEAHSPITPQKFYPYLRYTDTDSGQQQVVLTPIGQVLGFVVSQQ